MGINRLYKHKVKAGECSSKKYKSLKTPNQSVCGIAFFGNYFRATRLVACEVIVEFGSRFNFLSK